MRLLEHRATLLPLFALLFSGCISVAGGNLPQVPRVPMETAQAGGASINLQWLKMGQPAYLGQPLMMETVVQELKSSGMFSDISFSKGQHAHHIDISINNTGNIALAVITGVFSGLSLTILPGYARDVYEMTASVHRGDKLLKTYRLEDHINSWIQLFLVVAMPFRDRKEPLRETLKNMTWNLITRMKEDGLFGGTVPSPETPPGPASFDNARPLAAAPSAPPTETGKGPVMCTQDFKTGPQIDARQAKSIQSKEHTKADVLRWFGEPSKKHRPGTKLLGCVERWLYIHSNCVSGHPMQVKTLVVEFGADDHVCLHAYAEVPK